MTYNIKTRVVDDSLQSKLANLTKKKKAAIRSKHNQSEQYNIMFNAGGLCQFINLQSLLHEKYSYRPILINVNLLIKLNKLMIDIQGNFGITRRYNNFIAGKIGYSDLFNIESIIPVAAYNGLRRIFGLEQYGLFYITGGIAHTHCIIDGNINAAGYKTPIITLMSCLRFNNGLKLFIGADICLFRFLKNFGSNNSFYSYPFCIHVDFGIYNKNS